MDVHSDITVSLLYLILLILFGLPKVAVPRQKTFTLLGLYSNNNKISSIFQGQTMKASTLTPTNTSYLVAMKRAVKSIDTWPQVAAKISEKTGIDYSADYLQSIFAGDARPSYKLALALHDIANENIRKSRTKKWSTIFKTKGVRITAKKFDLRRLPFAHHHNTTPQYFESTPNREDFRYYHTGDIGHSLAWVADKLGVSERTLQKYIRNDDIVPAKWTVLNSPFKINGAIVTKHEVLNYIYDKSVENAEFLV
jgi:hypothetical protein